MAFDDLLETSRPSDGISDDALRGQKRRDRIAKSYNGLNDKSHPQQRREVICPVHRRIAKLRSQVGPICVNPLGKKYVAYSEAPVAVPIIWRAGVLAMQCRCELAQLLMHEIHSQKFVAGYRQLFVVIDVNDSVRIDFVLIDGELRICQDVANGCIYIATASEEINSIPVGIDRKPKDLVKVTDHAVSGQPPDRPGITGCSGKNAHERHHERNFHQQCLSPR